MEGLIKTVVVLGGGISEEGVLPIWVRSRLEKAIQLYSGTYNTQLIVCGKGRDNFGASDLWSLLCSAKGGAEYRMIG